MFFNRNLDLSYSNFGDSEFRGHEFRGQYPKFRVIRSEVLRRTWQAAAKFGSIGGTITPSGTAVPASRLVRRAATSRNSFSSRSCPARNPCKCSRIRLSTLSVMAGISGTGIYEFRISGKRISGTVYLIHGRLDQKVRDGHGTQRQDWAQLAAASGGGSSLDRPLQRQAGATFRDWRRTQRAEAKPYSSRNRAAPGG